MADLTDRDDLIDLAGTEPARNLGGFEPIPNGTYDMQFSVDEVGESKNGYPQVVGTWTVTDGPHAGKNTRDWVVFSPKSGAFIKARLIALGIPIPGASRAVELANYYAVQATGRIANLTVRVVRRMREDGTQQEFNEIVNMKAAPTFTRGGGTTTSREVVTEDEQETLF